MSAPTWGAGDRAAGLERAARLGVDLLVVGGGITGAGVLRDAASRGLRAFLVEREDFASGTSSRSSKMVHGGLRYIAEGHLGVTRESCRERDTLLRLNPDLVRPLPFLFPAYEGGKVPLWQVRAALWTYAALASFRRTARHRMLAPPQVAAFSGDLRAEGLRGAGLYFDAQVDDARLVLETLRSARRLGADAANHAEAIGFLHAAGGRVAGIRVRDALSDRILEIRAEAVINAAGPAVERLRGLDRPVERPEIRPAKGVHLVIPRARVHAEGAVTFEARDGRHLFLVPFGDVSILGTTDTFVEEGEEERVTIDDVHYVLSAANEAFPRVALTTNDLRSVFAGARPLVADGSAERPPSSVSREHRLYEDASGLISIAGGKLTTHRAMAEAIVDRALRMLPPERRAAAGRSRTERMPLREETADRTALESELRDRFGLPPARVEHLIASYGADAPRVLAEAPAPLRAPIGRSRFLFAEIPWALQRECAATLCDLLERRIRLVLFAEGQGLPELEAIATVAAEAAGWDAERTRAERVAYVAAVRRGYQIVPARAPTSTRLARSAA